MAGRVGLAQPTFHHASDHHLSTFGRQRRILVSLLGTLKLRNLSFFGSDQMDDLPETPQLGPLKRRIHGKGALCQSQRLQLDAMMIHLQDG
jgi:hypothetical protein